MSQVHGQDNVMKEEAGKKKKENKTFYCEFCNRMFTNVHAFGGHQNAHKRERNIAKREKAPPMCFTTNGSESVRSFYRPYYYNYPAMATAESQRNKALGVHPHSMIHKWNCWPAPRDYQLSSRQQEIVAAMMQQSQYSASASAVSRDGYFHQMEVGLGVNNGGNSTNNINTNLNETDANTSKRGTSSQNVDVECIDDGLDLTLKL